MLVTVQLVEENIAPCANVIDFCKTFSHEMSNLYLFSFLLTGNHDKAERCFISALHECVEETDVVRGWAASLTRLAIIKHAIQMIRPVPESEDNFSLISPAAQNSPFAAILALGAFERFVFVMSILEGWSEQDCALHLGCSRRDVTIARLLALKRAAGNYRLARLIVLPCLAREIFIVGECCFAIPTNGMVRRLYPAGSWGIRGTRRRCPMELHTIGIDRGKTVFHLVGLNLRGEVVVRLATKEPQSRTLGRQH